MQKIKFTKPSFKSSIDFSLIVIVMFFYELVFGFSTTGAAFLKSIHYALVSGLIYGLILTIPIVFLKGKARHIVRFVLVLISSLPFLVEYFIYKQFKTFYDINTVINGGEGAFKGFGSTIVSLILSPGGILRIILYILPLVALIVYAIKVKFEAEDYGNTIKLSCFAGIIVGLGLLASFIGFNKNDLNAYKREYSFQNSISKFGVINSINFDLMHIKDNEEGNLEFTTTEEDLAFLTITPTPRPTNTPAPTVPGATATPTPSPTPVPVPEVMDVDFVSIAETYPGVASLANYCNSLTPSMTNEYTGLFAGKNLILITAEAFTAEVIDPVRTPTLYRMATQGINFNDHYVQATAGTTGGEFSHIFGLLPTDGGSSVPRMTSRGNAVYNMGAMLNREGCYGMAFHNNDYAFYSRNTTHNNLGYSEGYMGWGNGLEGYIDPVWPESDLQMFEATVPMYIDHQPFSIYYMTVSGHSNYSHGANAMARAHWDETADLEEVYSGTVRAYLACNLELEASMTYLINQLEEAGIADDTVIVINADHYPYGLDHDAPPGRVPYLSELYGYEVTNYMERDHNRLIIWSGCLEDMDPIIVDSPTSSIDVLPTLLNLFGLEWDSRMFPGRDVFSDAMPLVFNLNYDWKTDLGTYISNRNEFIPNDPDAEIPEEYIEYVRDVVRNKITFCRGVLNNSFYRYVFESMYPETEE